MKKPSQEYTIHILEDNDFNKLPFGEPTEALGMTNSKTKTAWVRRTHVKEMDLGTLHHEFDELMAKTSDHEIDGIRYKKLKNFFRSVVPLLLSLVPGVGPILGVASGVGAAASGASDANKAAKKQANQLRDQQSAQQSAFSSPFASAPTSQTPAAPGPLSEGEFNKGLGRIDTNLSSRLGSLSQLFKGQTEGENTAFGNQATQARLGSQKSRDEFTGQQDEAKRIAGIL